MAEIELGYGKNVKDWAIRSQAPKFVMIEYGEGSESRWLWVLNDGLINLIRLKVYSDPFGNLRDIHGDEFTHAARCGIRSRTKEFGSRAISNN